MPRQGRVIINGQKFLTRSYKVRIPLIDPLLWIKRVETNLLMTLQQIVSFALINTDVEFVGLLLEVPELQLPGTSPCSSHIWEEFSVSHSQSFVCFNGIVR